MGSNKANVLWYSYRILIHSQVNKKFWTINCAKITLGLCLKTVITCEANLTLKFNLRQTRQNCIKKKYI